MDVGSTLARLVRERDEALRDRNLLVTLLASLYPSGRTDVRRQDGPACRGFVFVDLPTGQVSWSYDHDGHAYFAHLPPYLRGHDGHSSDDKRERIRQLAQQVAAARGRQRHGPGAGDRAVAISCSRPAAESGDAAGESALHA